MAKLTDLLAFSGAVGDMVGCKGPHGFYIRSRPRKSHKEPTARQLEVRARLALVMGFLKPLKAVIHLGFSATNTTRTKMSAMNAAASHVLNHAIAGEYPDLQIEPEEVRLSRGMLQGLADVGIGMLGTSVDVTWSTEPPQFIGYPDDRVTIVVYHPAEKTVMVGKVSRDAGAVSVDVSDEPTGSELLVYACVSDRDRKEFSNSQFLGRITYE
ncbi:hypothetical protein GCM10007415_23060 [Parapedobacter pyrenivorans]|uniref:Uncharacterized protein n=1 Tax=Parapedobacter pyrenivorans TaxID=1305674 RepID=A0A917HT25_9SPHI|nr:DUF6266 family protein [Parapedobacter pyrenivorans]GGG88416.1 hypothetical protein GCM10007415_23060 [Parapedobacter pyrenivorans]